MAVTEKRLTYLKSKVSDELEEKYGKNFNRMATYRGNGVYEWAGVFSTDIRELFLLGIIGIEGIKIRGEK